MAKLLKKAKLTRERDKLALGHAGESSQVQSSQALACLAISLPGLNRLKQLLFRSPAALEHIDQEQGGRLGVWGTRLASALGAHHVKHALQHVEVFWIEGIRRQVPLHLSTPGWGESAFLPSPVRHNRPDHDWTLRVWVMAAYYI
ncbi:hypothetical protein MPLA_1550030 [Mesorhizobium sp. ORS 3359]|nr:hypothetical protein MPLA_1550030 [Mesorhizobium sp. ORS 3359]